MSEKKRESPKNPGGKPPRGGGPRGRGDAANLESGWAAGEGAEAESQLEELQAENAELKDRLLRTMADMENLLRRTEREKADTAKYAISNFARDVLSIGDNLRRAIDAVPEEAIAGDAALKSLLDGVEVTERELVNMMERHGITRIDPKGERFDPNFHQAMLEIENKDMDAGTVAEVVQPGYVIEDRVLRPAMVAVSKGGPKRPKPEEPAEMPQAANDDEPPAKPTRP